MIIMQRVPDEELYNNIKNNLISMEEIDSIEKINMWTIDGEVHILTASIKAVNDANKSNLLEKIKDMLLSKDIKESTIEIY